MDQWCFTEMLLVFGPSGINRGQGNVGQGRINTLYTHPTQSQYVAADAAWLATQQC